MAKAKDFLVALDDGHGMETSGKRSPILPSGLKSETGNFMHENEFNRAVVKYLNAELKRLGFNTLLVAPTDKDTPLADRTNLANSKKADVYVSVHANASAGKWFDGGGIETFCYASSASSKKLATAVHKRVMGGTKFKDRGVKDGSDLWVIRKTSMPSILVELGFMDSNQDIKNLLKDSYRKECAVEIAQGICDYFGVTYVKEEVKKATVKPASKTVYRVRKSKDDVKTQKGAFASLESAKELADKNSGYEVYDGNGKLVYTPKKAEVKSSTIYRVRKSKDDAKTQKGAYKDLASAKELADKNNGYEVYDDKGKVVYTPKKQSCGCNCDCKCDCK